MAKYKFGITGPFSGKVATVVGASWRGIDYMRGLPRKSGKPSTEGQLRQQSKMLLFRSFLLSIGSIIEKGFQNIEQYTPMNAALSYNMKYSVAGIYPDDVVDFKELLFTQGNLFCASSAAATSTESRELVFTWVNRAFTHLAAADDVVILVAYCPAQEKFSYLADAGIRKIGEASLTLPQSFSGHTVHCYLSFRSADEKHFSPNTYLGEVLVT
ncbi:DUF6266 family protein [Pedobacter sp. MC2016-14]|uniref:DUF6266 family protein n=1 Tax=Pedobacter sp. MC2016-14 TaxID=2897327 RepID=UPI001E43A672|nr:DUF6266 family protein [Pedobacter sp. MC2016-14]MCD0488201.1 DUF6266 family protein [Pedobacter sp. MC2016-14]